MSDSDKTEEPTPRRLRLAREEGDSGVSSYAAQALAMVGAVALIPASARALAARTGDDLRQAIGQVARPGQGAHFEPLDLARAVIALASPILLAAAVIGGAAYVLQTGGAFSMKRVAPNLGRLDLVAGLRGLFSATRVFSGVRGVASGLAVAWLSYDALSRSVGDLARLAGQPRSVGVLVGAVAGGLAWRAALLGLFMGALDLVVSRRAWMRRLRMTKEEVKRELRESEGDPRLRAARERAYQELIAQATIASVRGATVVVVNPTHVACALRYDEKGGDEAPVVVASGEGDLAARIVQAAREWGVPVVRDVPIARALLELGVGDAIPETLYEAVAEILREVWGDSAVSG